MIDLFAIFSKGGLVLWCFQGAKDLVLTPSINALIREIFLQERGNTTTFKHNGATLRFKLDNEFELVFLAVYQSIVQLSYVDKLLTDVHLQFRDKYKNVLENTQSLYPLCGSNHFSEFDRSYLKLLKSAEETKVEQKGMRNWKDTDKSMKNMALAHKGSAPPPEKKVVGGGGKSQIPVPQSGTGAKTGSHPNKHPEPEEEKKNDKEPETQDQEEKENDQPKEKEELSEIEKARMRFFEKQKKGVKPKPSPKAKPATNEKGKRVKDPRKWDLNGKAEDAPMLDFSDNRPDSQKHSVTSLLEDESQAKIDELRSKVGTMQGELKGLDENVETGDSEEEEEEEEEDSEEESEENITKETKSGKGGLGLFSAFKSLVGNKKLTLEDIQPALDKMKDHLIGKNVAAEIAVKLCESVGSKLEGKVIGTFSGVTGTVKATLKESLVQLLSPKRRVDILRDVEEAKHNRRPYSVVFCGVNGVGKSTNLAKITFWLNDNGYRVLIAACDTFRAGAVEQLRTHARHLNALHPNHVDLYEQGYGKDAAAIAAQAISYATANKIDVVLVDTAGRMQDNEPLMRALAKLIKVNEPDAVLFVGEALVGNEAVDQLVKFNQALADHATPGVTARLIDGIVLTKFDTIDDKVGAAISMTYITGQPIVFVGTGQTYSDLKNLNANAVVQALLK